MGGADQLPSEEIDRNQIWRNPESPAGELDADEALDADDEALDADMDDSFADVEREQGTVSDEERHRMIAEIAYYLAEGRGFDSGLELDDWLQAEAEVRARLSSA